MPGVQGRAEYSSCATRSGVGLFEGKTARERDTPGPQQGEPRGYQQSATPTRACPINGRPVSRMRHATARRVVYSVCSHQLASTSVVKTRTFNPVRVPRLAIRVPPSPRAGVRHDCNRPSRTMSGRQRADVEHQPSHLIHRRGACRGASIVEHGIRPGPVLCLSIDDPNYVVQSDFARRGYEDALRGIVTDIVNRHGPRGRSARYSDRREEAYC